jgi:hypothetical protein
VPSELVKVVWRVKREGRVWLLSATEARVGCFAGATLRATTASPPSLYAEAHQITPDAARLPLLLGERRLPTIAGL